jgi:alanyl-tRNA synthetase
VKYEHDHGPAQPPYGVPSSGPLSLVKTTSGGVGLVAAVEPGSGRPASDLIKDAAKAVGGGGGGKGDIATAGGKDVSGIPTALQLAAQAVAEAVAAGS